MTTTDLSTFYLQTADLVIVHSLMVYSETTDIKMVDFPAFDLLVVISLVVDSFIFILPVDLTDLPKD